jgi:hypothetical protein
MLLLNKKHKILTCLQLTIKHFPLPFGTECGNLSNFQDFGSSTNKTLNNTF